MKIIGILLAVLALAALACGDVHGTISAPAVASVSSSIVMHRKKRKGAAFMNALRANAPALTGLLGGALNTVLPGVGTVVAGLGQQAFANTAKDIGKSTTGQGIGEIVANLAGSIFGSSPDDKLAAEMADRDLVARALGAPTSPLTSTVTTRVLPAAVLGGAAFLAAGPAVAVGAAAAGLLVGPSIVDAALSLMKTSRPVPSPVQEGDV